MFIYVSASSTFFCVPALLGDAFGVVGVVMFVAAVRERGYAFFVFGKKALNRLKAQRGKKEGTIDARFREVVWQLMDAEVKKENSLVLQGITQASVCSLLEKNHSPSLLVDVSLCGCQLTTVPECLSTLSRLEILDLRNNAIASFEPIYNALLPHHCWNRLKLFVFLFSCSCLIYMS